MRDVITDEGDDKIPAEHLESIVGVVNEVGSLMVRLLGDGGVVPYDRLWMVFSVLVNLASLLGLSYVSVVEEGKRERAVELYAQRLGGAVYRTLLTNLRLGAVDAARRAH